ncbi:MAG TPA: substrate-binding domain-containing protein [Xanthobacteraceae bacterium]|nr:substrate-binding domain-containing protein [Xanthobacteraceae bacterium]
MKRMMFLAILSVSVLATSAACAHGEKGQDVKVYAAAVVKAPLAAIAAEYENATGHKVIVVLDTAGATEQRFRADPEAALLITTAPLIQNAESRGALRDGTATLLGSTVAGVAVTPGLEKPDVSTPEKLKAALLAARRIAVSDPARGATVGAHFMKVIETLGVKDEVLRKIAFAPDGLETTRRVVAGEADFGVSQSSEIVQASRDAFAGPFPREFALATNFSLWHRDNISPVAADFAARLTSPAGRERFAAEGIIPPGTR